ncbi:MFS transporter [Erythrobacter sp. F6033]|uniref:MFS transporter n=1 Tax=Erythrobacter sp. F6033 TaxID=2926401 RepID=UPI001FF56408|nr:MFS transporter [Erythrobacter sp. F6033]MCK0127467.1 MFS transporter [Erythrobacter sp. F6033]
MSLVQGKLPLRLKLIHGFGAVAFGVKDTGFSFFLLFFYSQVLGMDAGLVSLALLLALLVDAFVDPIIGNLSDRTYTRWGRRLPWLYVAPIPLAFAWVLLWSPPGGEAPTFWGLFGICVVVRLLLSACEVPSISLLPEITSDYVERTTLFRFRYLSGWLGGILMMIIGYGFLFTGESGLLDQSGYIPFGIIGAILMVISVMGSALGQHKLVANLPLNKPAPFSIKACFSEIFEAFSEKAFLFFAAGGLAAYISQGLNFSLSNYLNVFVWRLDATPLPGLPDSVTGLSIYPLILFLSVVLMFNIVGPMHNRFGKPKSAAIGAVASTILVLLPYSALLLGFWPEPGSLSSLGLIFVLLIVGNALGIVVMVSASSMIAEIVEAHLERTGVRAEGAFYSGNWLVQKCATGVGIFLSGQFLSLASFTSDVTPETVAPAVIDNLIILYAVTTAVLMLIAGYWLGRFPITREDHEARIAAMASKPAE